MEEETKERKSVDDQIKEDLEKAGWQRAGMEYPFGDRFDHKAMFVKTREMTDEDIRQIYLDKYGEYFDEVRLEIAHKLVARKEVEDDRRVYVYMRNSKNKLA